MQTCRELIALARKCVQRAQTVSNRERVAALMRLADRHLARAAESGDTTQQQQQQSDTALMRQRSFPNLAIAVLQRVEDLDQYQRRTFHGCADIRTTVTMTQKYITQSQALMGNVDRVIARLIGATGERIVLDREAPELGFSKRMRRFFFHITAGQQLIRDDEGTSFPSVVDAMEHAATVAAELGRNRREISHGEVFVLDGAGCEVFRTPVICN